LGLSSVWWEQKPQRVAVAGLGALQNQQSRMAGVWVVAVQAK
jgi:hypothetical protein